MDEILCPAPPSTAASPPGGVATQRLASLRVIVDGQAPLMPWVCTALRTVGIGLVEAGAYAAEPLSWDLPRPRRRDHRATVRAEFTPPEVAAVVAVSQGRLNPQVARPWLVKGLMHLPVEVHADLIQVGPLIVPGLSACLACHTSIAPPVLARAPHSAPAPAPDIDPAMGVLAAALAALTLRSALLGDRSLAGVSCDVIGPRPEVVHRYWSPDPRCSCRSGSWRSA